VRSQDLKRAKRDIRKRVLAARDAIDATQRAADADAVTDRLLALPEIAGARSALAFWSFGSELPTQPLIHALDERGVTVSLPAIVEGDLEVRAYRLGDPTTMTPFGAREPADGRRLDPAELDVIVTPAVAYDRSGRRVGYGGGFYDRFLPMTRSDAFRVGMGSSVQLLDEDLPAGAFDLRVDAIVTPDEIVRCSR
jgi:5-formyltetrahydrofolate cyclo-ligase